jgi:hypothetical protein
MHLGLDAVLGELLGEFLLDRLETPPVARGASPAGRGDLAWLPGSDLEGDVLELVAHACMPMRPASGA